MPETWPQIDFRRLRGKPGLTYSTIAGTILALFAGTPDWYPVIDRVTKEAYRKLSANQRHAVYLYYIKELTWEEVAEILGITVHSSMNLIGRAIVKLRRLFENK